VKPRPSILVFGGRGAIGSAVRTRFTAIDWTVTATSRVGAGTADADLSTWITCDPSSGTPGTAQLGAGMPYAAVCWAQGSNMSDSVLDVDSSKHLDLYRANCLFVLETLRILLDRDMLTQTARLVVVSSIWQRVARQNKLSYIMSKAALGGLVQSASVDLAERGILINAVLPSVLDTAMTAANLTPAQIDGIAGATGFGRLASVDAVVAAIEFLCSERNIGITGQSVAVDLGYSHARLV
jgi:3-oxoacyl-[acyl-carrier protein] reductase